MKSRSLLQGAALGRAVLLQNSPGGGDGAWKNKSGPEISTSVGLWMSSICLQRVKMGKTSERTDCSSLDLQLVCSIFRYGVLRVRMEAIEAKFFFLTEGRKYLLLICFKSGLIKGDSC